MGCGWSDHPCCAVPYGPPGGVLVGGARRSVWLPSGILGLPGCSRAGSMLVRGHVREGMSSRETSDPPQQQPTHHSDARPAVATPGPLQRHPAHHINARPATATPDLAQQCPTRHSNSRPHQHPPTVAFSRVPTGHRTSLLVFTSTSVVTVLPRADPDGRWGRASPDGYGATRGREPCSTLDVTYYRRGSDLQSNARTCKTGDACQQAHS
jgi:hypothetical protein